jgi:predicted choloylglycine hydrolase
MPELVPLWEELTALVEGEEQDTLARMLSLVDPAAYVAGCSQAIWTHGAPMLVRNYDYRPEAFEGAILKTRWLDTTVLAVSDCLWGALDGINEHGLAVALAFGGSPVRGRGFGIPLILRYVLELCRTVDEAAEVLERVPSHMAYNVSLLDARGEFATAYLAPQRRPQVVRERVATNHQRDIEWSEYAEVTHSEERHRFLTDRLAKARNAERFVERFLEAPLYATDHAKGYGTLYTVAYRPEERSAEFRWPHCRVTQEVDRFVETELVVGFG